MRQLLDTGAERRQRCGSVETLNEIGATLAPRLLHQLLADDDSTVARYALGLIPPSAQSTALIKKAASSRHTGDQAFSEELTLLDRIV